MRWTHLARKTSACGADGEVVLSRSPDAGINSRAKELEGTVARKPGAPRRPRISRNPLRRGCRLCRLSCCCLRAQRCSLLGTQGHGCGQHPAFPAPSVLGGARFPPNLGRIAPREGVVARKAKTRFGSEICGGFLKWLGNLVRLGGTGRSW
jgi:hypothetical protein